MAGSFAWPFRGRWQARWALGAATVLLLPIAFIPLLGYALAATRSAAANPLGGPPTWRLSGRLLTDGFWLAVVLLLLTAPFALVLLPLASALSTPSLWQAGGSLLRVYGLVTAVFILALPWGMVILLLMPHATARYAASSRPKDLFDFRASVRGVRRDFPTWNITVSAIVTAWAIGVACIGLLCVGLFPGIFYAILVSAHATAALDSEGPEGAGPPAR